MKKCINIIMTIIVIVILKGCVLAPIYLLFAPFVTAYKWGFRWTSVKAAIPFEYRCVWHTLCNDWKNGCAAFIFKL